MASTSTSSYTGCVKWFNNNLNYGFITVLTDGENQNKDIFVHQSNIKTKRDCYRTLYSGECVQFDLTQSQNPAHPVHAINVTGFNGVMLHCENPAYRPKRFNNRNGNNGGRPNRHNDVSGEGNTNESNQVQTSNESSTPVSDSQTAEFNKEKVPRGKPSGRGRPRKQ
jgi:cold shock CspA family protein